MPSIVIDRIGPDGTFETLSDWASELPSDLTVTDEIRVAELGLTVTDPGNAVIETICDATRYVAVRAEAGASVADTSDPTSMPLRVEAGQGALIHATAGSAIALSGLATRAEVHGIQILADAGIALDSGSEGSRFERVSGCVLDATSNSPAVTLQGASAEMYSCVVIQRGAGDGITLLDGASVEGCTVFKPEQAIATGTGIAPSGTSGSEARSVAVSGFGQAFGTDLATASDLGSDQINLLTAPDDLTDPYWTRVSAGIDGTDTIVGPTGIALQRVSNNLNGFSFFSAPVVHSVAPSERFAFSMIVSDVTAKISALLIDSASGKPEMRANWEASPPTVSILGATAPLKAVTGTVTDLGGGAYRMFIEVENTTAAPIAATPIFYVTRGVENVGLDVGMYAGSAMAGNGHLGNGFSYPGAVPGVDPVEGFDPSAVYANHQAAQLDLRPIAGSALESSSGAPALSSVDVYRRHRGAPETVGAVSLNAVAPVVPDDVVPAIQIEAAHALDEAEIISAFRSRTVLPASPVRVLTP